MSDKLDKVLLSPALRVENQDYHRQTLRVMIRLTRFYDYMLMLASFMEMKHRTFKKLSSRKEFSSEVGTMKCKENYEDLEPRYSRVIEQASTTKAQQEALILFYKKMIMEHCHLQHTLETWRAAILNSTFKPKPPLEGFERFGFDPKTESKRLLEIMNLTEKECSLPVDNEHLKGEMIELGLLQHDSVMTRESCRRFFDSLSDKSAMLKLENYNQNVAKKKYTVSDMPRQWCLFQGVNRSHADYSFQHDILTSDVPFTGMEAIPKLKKVYDLQVAKKYSIKKPPPVLPDISQQLVKEMEEMAAQVPAFKEMGQAQDQNDKCNPTGIDRYQEYVEIKRKLQGRIKLAENADAKINSKVPEDKPKQADQSPDITKKLCLVRQLLETVSSTPGANSSRKYSDNLELKKERNRKRVKDYQSCGLNSHKDEPASKKVKAAPEQLPFLKSVAVQNFKIPKVCKTSSKPKLSSSKIGVKRGREGVDEEEDAPCYGKKPRNC